MAVLEQARAELLDYNGCGMSVMEMSHRSFAFEDILGRAESDLRTLLSLGQDHAILFLQGGASLQFAMLPMNLRGPGQSADYILSGHWSKVALKEAEKLGRARVAASSEGTAFDRVPAASELEVDARSAYLHFTSNNTIYGTEWFAEPEPPTGVPLVCDASSDFLSRPLPCGKYGLIYAGAQKNVGPAGVTVVVIRRDLFVRVPPGLPALLDYRLLAETRSLHNTPPCFAIYMVGLVLRWIREEGGLAAIERLNRQKASLVYDAIDASGGFYRGHARKDSRSLMNVTFRLPSEELEKTFVSEATAEGLDGLKGHRSVGGLRASLYNALPVASVQALVQFMQDFGRRNG
jgi:phosphoserine aminotransferase